MVNNCFPLVIWFVGSTNWNYWDFTSTKHFKLPINSADSPEMPTRKCSNPVHDTPPKTSEKWTKENDPTSYMPGLL